MIKKTLYIIVITTILSGCKKDKQEPLVSTTPLSYYDGILTAGITQNMFSDTLDPYPYGGGDAWFGHTPSPEYSSTNFTTVDSISLDNVFFKFSDFYYQDTSYMITNLIPIKWHVKGNHGIPDFDFTNTSSLPGYTGYSSLPDTIDRHQDLNIPISGLTNTTKGLIVISDGLHTVFKEFSTSDHSVTFTASQLSSLIPNSFSYIYVNLKNQNPQVIGGKKLRFDNFYQVTNFVVIK
jgi:hypothetical protein